MKTQFDNEELEILKAYENNELKVSKNNKTEIDKSITISNLTIKRNKEKKLQLDKLKLSKNKNSGQKL